MKRTEVELKQQAFVEEYLTCWNASEAARRAGYKTQANVQGARLLANDSIRAKIETRLKEKAMGADEVLARLAEHARGDFSSFLTATGTIDLTSDDAKAKLFLLKRVKVTSRKYAKDDEFEEYHTEIELHDPQAALVHIGRHHKLFTDAVEQTVSGNLKIEYVNDWRTKDQAPAPASGATGDTEQSS
jgi:hypothetical protein